MYFMYLHVNPSPADEKSANHEIYSGARENF